MGLSSYGKPIYSKLIKEKIFKNFYKLELNLDYFNHTNKDYVYNLAEHQSKTPYLMKKF